MSTPRPIEGGSYIRGEDGVHTLVESTGDPECDCGLSPEQLAVKNKAQADAEAEPDFLRSPVISQPPTEEAAPATPTRVTRRSSAAPEA